MLRPTVSRPVHLGIKHSYGAYDHFVLLSDSFRFVDVGRSIWREDGFVVYNCCWSSRAQSFSGPSPVGLVTTFYCHRFETPSTWRARSPYLYPPGTGFPFHRLLLLAGLRWRYSTPPPHGIDFHYSCNPRYIASGRTQQKTSFPNNYSIVIDMCLPRRCIQTAVLLLSFAYSFPRECVNRVVP
jgi:hypothetical protein